MTTALIIAGAAFFIAALLSLPKSFGDGDATLFQVCILSVVVGAALIGIGVLS